MFSEKIHRNIFLIGLCCLAFGIMLGSSPTSVAQVLLLTNWLLEADFKRKFTQLKKNKLFWALSAVFFIHVVGLFYTENFSNGINDLRTKLPLLFTPLIFFSTKPPLKNEYYALLYAFLVGCFFNTAWSLFYSHFIHSHELLRDASRFMSHIRLGLFLNLAISCCIYFLIISKSTIKKIIFLVLGFYFIFVLYALGIASGIFNFLVLSFFASSYLIYKQKTSIKLTSLVIFIGTFFLIFNYILKIKNAQLSLNKSKNNTILVKNISGNLYSHYTNSGQKENGNYVQINIQFKELKKAWQHEFPEDSFSYGKNATNINRYEVLIRYLASKGLNKDSAGFSKLNTIDKLNIKKNITNYLYQNWSHLHKRIYELVNEYDEFINNRSINGHSLSMRLYFLKAAFILIKNNFLFGVGSGDLQNQLDKTYVDSKSPLVKEWYKHPHNQFVTIFVTLGLMGFLIFSFSILYPLITLKNYFPILFWPFFILAMGSFILDDTLETQAGISFYAIYNTLFMSIAMFKKQQNLEG